MIPNDAQKAVNNFAAMIKNQKIVIDLEEWEYTCADGCCTDYQIKVKFNGEELEDPRSTAEEHIHNNYLGDDVELSLRAVLKKLGYNNVEVNRTRYGE